MVFIILVKLPRWKTFFEHNVCKKMFTIMHQNIASALSKTDILELTLANLNDSNSLPDVICLSETFLKSGHENNFKLSNYELAAFFSRQKKRGGVCILVKTGLNYKKNTNVSKRAVSEVFECCAVDFPDNNLIVICVYRTPTSNVVVFLDNLDSLLYELNMKKNKKIVILGDINIDTLKTNKMTNTLQDLTKNYNLTIHINEPTRKLSCIDHILSNIENASASVLHLGLSDHETAQMLYFSVESKDKKPMTSYTYKRKYNVENINRFKNYISKISFNEVFVENDLNTAYDTFHDTVLLFYNLCFPKEKVKIHTKKNRMKWITAGLRKSCKTKRNLRVSYYKNKTKRHKDDYLNYSKLLRKCIYQSQKNENNKFINNSKNKSKASWQVIKDVEPNISHYDIDKIIYNNETICDPMRITEAFSKYFIDSSNKTTQIIPKKTKLKVITLGNSIYLKPMTELEVKTQVLSLNNTHSEGPDEICTNVIKQCADELIPVLTYLINLSFERGEFPKRLKLSLVKPVYKKGCKSDITNYRPITLIPIISKIFEKCMFIRLMNYCTDFNIICKDQYGFQKQKSTTSAMFALLREILTNVDLKKLTTVLFLDMSKAFDLVDHDILLQKLEKIGVRGIALQWFESYLQNRKQSVVITKTEKNNIRQAYHSRYICNRFGVPQGSVLGPLLFIIYINDIINVTRHKTILFADDISIIVTNEIREGLTKHEAEINNTLLDIIEWLDDNNLRINLTKTNYMQFNNFIDYKFKISYKDSIIEQADFVKFLGIYIDKQINWKTQVDKVCDRVNRFVYVLHRLRHIADRSTILAAYHAYIASILRYGLILWGNSVDAHKVFVCQKKCVRAICGIPPYETCRHIFKQLNLLTLPSLYIFEICKFVKNHPSLFHRASDVYPRNTRSPDRLVLNFVPRTALYMKNCLNMCINIYNKIPKCIKILRPRQFQNQLYAWLLDKNFYSIKELITQ